MAAAPLPVLSAETAESKVSKRNLLLLIGGWFSLAFAVFQASGIWWPPRAVKYLGGPAKLCEENPLLYSALCISIAIVVAVFGFYALSGGGAIRRLPLLRTMLIGVTSIYVLRGVLLFPQLLTYYQVPRFMPIRFLLFSVIALGVGLVHLAGVLQFFRRTT